MGCFAMGNEIPQRAALIFSCVTRLLVLVCIGISTHRKKDLFLLDNTKDSIVSTLYVPSILHDLLR